MENQEKTKKAIYQEWWFWLVIIIVFIVVFSLYVTKNNNNITNNTNVNNNTNTSNKTKVATNPYQITTDYDGVYKFVLSSDNGMGHTFTSKGAISFSNGTCKAKFMNGSDTIDDFKQELEGFCGLNDKDNSNFYFSLNDNEIIYKCNKIDSTLSCELKSTYDICGCQNNQLTLTFVDSNTQTIDTVFTQVQEEEKAREAAEEQAKKEQEEKTFKESCQTYTYEQIARNPDNFKGTNVKLTGEVIQTLYSGNTVDLRINITKYGSYSTYYKDTVYVVYTPSAGEDKILEDDIITVYGIAQGDYSYTSTIGSLVTLPLISGKYITIEK